MMTKRRLPFGYDPSADSGLSLWFDPSDSSTNSLLDTGGTSISNGETIGTVKSKKGTARSFTQWGSNTRPTWDSTGINGIGAIRSNSQILTTQTALSDFASMSGLTAMCVVKINTSVGGSCAFSFTMVDTGTAKYDISMMQLRATSTYNIVGRRLGSDTLAGITGDSAPTTYIVGGVFDYANAKFSIFQSGAQGLQDQTFQTAGTTSASEPSAISIGGFAQETGSSAAGLCDAWIGECLVWLGTKTPTQLVDAHHYLRRKWGVS